MNLHNYKLPFMVLLMQKRISMAVALFALMLLSVMRVKAAIFVVTDTNDTVNVTSLRGAIIAANRLGRNNTIILGANFTPHRNQQHQWIYRLTIPGADEAASRTGDLDVTRGNLMIIGMSPNVTIDATGLGDRVFQVFSNAHLTLESLTITGGTAPQAQPGSFYTQTPDAEFGGAIYNVGVLTLRTCVITNNSSGGGNYNPGNGGGRDGGDGGGIYNSGTLSASDSAIIDNFCGAGVDGASGGSGGGIRNNGTCILSESVIYGNQSGAGGGPAGNTLGFGGDGGNGAGIYNTGTMILNECVIGANSNGQGANSTFPGISLIGGPGTGGGYGGNGAGIFNVGQMQLNFSTVYNNRSGNGGDGGSFGSGGQGGIGGSGAGIFNAGTLNMNTSTISDNTAGKGGNGGDGYFYGGAVGGVGGVGGGICNLGTLNVTSSTIVLNQTGAGGNGGSGAFYFSSSSMPSGGQSGDGGGIWNEANGTVATRNTLVALNLVNVGGAGGTNTSYAIMLGQEPTQQIGEFGSIGIGFDIAGNFISQGFNLISTGNGSTGFVDGVSADQVGSDSNAINPLLGPLQINGGFTPTHALLWGSPAIDQGKCFGIHFDQRGHYRPHDYPSIPSAPGGDGSDIGAFELDTL